MTQIEYSNTEARVKIHHRKVDSCDRVFAAGAEDRATLESDASAVVGECTKRAEPLALP
jgi:hypothetical protein